MDGPPLVSVVVPVFNGERFVRESLDSILGQTLRDVEVIVMDDASTDGAPAIVRSYDDRRIRYVCQERNLGIFGNLNAGIRLARGAFVAFYHADDVYDPTILEKELELLGRRPELGAVFAIDTFIDGNGEEWGRLELPPEFRAERTLTYDDVLNGFLRYGNSFIRGGTSLVRREVYDAVGLFDEAFDLRADLDMWLRIVRHAPIAILDEHLVAYRWGHDNTSARYEHVRTAPEISFTIIDGKLDAGDRALAAADALAAYEGRRAEDLLGVATNLYVKRLLGEARTMLKRVSPRRIAATHRVRRSRLLALFAGLHVVCRLPWSRVVADELYRRRHAGGAR